MGEKTTTPHTTGQTETRKHTPIPWSIEEDWTAEIIGADGTLIGKIVYPSNINDARFLVESVNSHATNLSRITELEAQVKALREALEDVVDPVSYLRRYAESRDAVLDVPMAHHLANDVGFVKGIAKEALARSFTTEGNNGGEGK